jgi:hypothetical protein|nr:hypothetical protein 13 [bacterium]
MDGGACRTGDTVLLGEKVDMNYRQDWAKMRGPDGHGVMVKWEGHVLYSSMSLSNYIQNIQTKHH